MAAQNFKNLAYTLVATAPSPAASGTSLVVTGGDGALLPSVPFQGTIWPASSIPTAANAEIVTVTNVSTDTLTITRAQEGTSARTVIVGDQFAATVTALMISTLEAGISAVSAAVTSVDTHAGAASAAATSADGHAAAASAAATSVDTRVNTVSNLVSALTSAHNALSNIVSDSLSIGDVASAKLVSVSAQLTSLEVHASAASAAATSADAHANAASAAATSVNSRVTSVNAAISAISARSVGDVSTHGFQSVINALSGRISAIVAGAASVTSAEVQTLSTAVTSMDTHAATASAAATSVLAAHNTLSNIVSIIAGGAASVARGHVVGDTQVISSTTLVNISGLSVSVSAGGVYQLDAMVLINRGTTSTPVRVGMTFPVMTRTRGHVMLGVSAATGAPVAVSAIPFFGAWNGDSASGSIIIQGNAGSITRLSTQATYQGLFKVSATGVIQLQAAASVGPAEITILDGSYVRVYRLP